jgi:probable addiction module antidote protein
MTNRLFKDYHLEELKKGKQSKQYLNLALESYFKDGDREAFFQALQDVVEANGGATQISKKAEINRQNLYKIFSGTRNPRLETIENILHALGFTFKIEAI